MATGLDLVGEILKDIKSEKRTHSGQRLFLQKESIKDGPKSSEVKHTKLFISGKFFIIFWLISFVNIGDWIHEQYLDKVTLDLIKRRFSWN